MFKFLLKKKASRGVVTLGEYPIGYRSVYNWSTQILLSLHLLEKSLITISKKEEYQYFLAL